MDLDWKLGLRQRLRLCIGDWGLRFVIEIIGNGDWDGGLGWGIGIWDLDLGFGIGD